MSQSFSRPGRAEPGNFSNQPLQRSSKEFQRSQPSHIPVRRGSRRNLSSIALQPRPVRPISPPRRRPSLMVEPYPDNKATHLA
jgi:hypothetical protein